MNLAARSTVTVALQAITVTPKMDARRTAGVVAVEEVLAAEAAVEMAVALAAAAVVAITLPRLQAAAFLLELQSSTEIKYQMSTAQNGSAAKINSMAFWDSATPSRRKTATPQATVTMTLATT